MKVQQKGSHRQVSAELTRANQQSVCDMKMVWWV